MDRRAGLGKSNGEKCFQLGKPRETWREPMLAVRLSEGEAFALPYAHLSFIKLESPKSLLLTFSSHLVKIEGDHLWPLYEALAEHTVRFVAACIGSTPKEPNEPTISNIELVPLGNGDGGMI